METFFYGLSGLLVTGIPSYAVSQDRGLVWCMKACACSGIILGAVMGFLNAPVESRYEPLVLAPGIGFMTWLLGIPMYFWMDTCKDLEKEKEEENSRKDDRG